VKASRGPREGVVAVKLPDGVAVRNVPLVISLSRWVGRTSWYVVTLRLHYRLDGIRPIRGSHWMVRLRI